MSDYIGEYVEDKPQLAKGHAADHIAQAILILRRKAQGCCALSAERLLTWAEVLQGMISRIEAAER